MQNATHFACYPLAIRLISLAPCNFGGYRHEGLKSSIKSSNSLQINFGQIPATEVAGRKPVGLLANGSEGDSSFIGR